MTRFGDIVGQERAIGSLRDFVARGRVPHALLFSGPSGIGKRATAVALGAFLLCEHRTAEDSCGGCASCRDLAAGRHPDFWIVEPPPAKEPRSGAKALRERRALSIDQVREIQQRLALAAFGDRRRIVVIDDAQTLSPPAQNALLKTLEEPPGNALIVLVARSPSALLPTVRSRCQQIPFQPLQDRDVELLLRERFGRSADDARLLASWADGSVGRATSVAPETLREAEGRLQAILDARPSGGYRQVVEAAEWLRSIGQPAGLWLLLQLLRRRLRASAGLAVQGELTRPVKTVSLVAALRAAEHAYRAAADLDENANPAIALERMWAGIRDAMGAGEPGEAPGQPAGWNGST